MLFKRSGKVEKSRGISKFEQTIKVKLVLCSVRESQFTARNKKWCVAAKSCRLDLNESLFSIGVKRKDIVTKTVPLCLGNVLDFFCKPSLT